MYTQVWIKFLPVIRIMIKRSIAEQQLVKTNRTDFDKAGGGRKVGYNFAVEIASGKSISRPTSLIAQDLITVLLQDEATMATLKKHSFAFEMNTKCELQIRCTSATQVAVDLEDTVTVDPGEQ